MQEVRAEVGAPGVPGMKTTRLARRLGVDGNPLRRRTDKIAACLAALLVALFLIGAPLLSVAAVGWAGRVGAGGQQAQRSWRQMPTVLLQNAPAPAAAYGVIGYSWVRARWIAPDGRTRTGRIPVSTSLAAGGTVRLWVNAAGSPAGPPVNHGALLARQATAAVVAIAALGIALLCLAWAGRWVLDRRRLADWEAAWATVGPRGPNASGCGASPDDRTRHHRSAQAYQAADHGNRPAGGFGNGGGR